MEKKRIKIVLIPVSLERAIRGRLNRIETRPVGIYDCFVPVRESPFPGSRPVISIPKKWQGCLSQTLLAARALMILKYQRLLWPEECVCHKCNVAQCINPDHLYIGSRQSNLKDRFESGMSRLSRLEYDSLAKID